MAVYSEADRTALHVRVADEAWLLGAGAPAESYLNQEKIVETALRAGAEAIHPGYGFLAENATFARAVDEAGLTWIGPPPEAIEAMGSKTEARERMKAAGVPIIPGTTEPVETAAEVVRLGAELGLAARDQGVRGRRGEGLPRRARGRRRRTRTRDRAPRRRGLLLEPGRLRRALPRGSSPRRGAAPGRCPRQRHPPGRARLHDPAPSPEAGRGNAVAGGRRRPPRADRRDRRGGGPRGRVPLRGNGRGFARSGRRLLLHGDEHAHPGRTHRHGTGHRSRPRPGAGADRGRRAAIAAPGGRPPRRARVRVPDQRGGSVRRLPADPRADHGLPRAGWAGRTGRLRRGGRLRGLAALRSDDRQARRPRRRPGARTAADAAGAGRVPHRRRDDAARLPPGAAPPPVLRRRRDLPRRGGVGAAGPIGAA